MLVFVSASKKELPKNGAGGSPSKMPTTRVFPLLVRFTLVTVSGLVVCIIPNFSDLMNIIGAVFGTILAFIMPALCHYSLFRRGIKQADLVMDVMLIVVGCLGRVSAARDSRFDPRQNEGRNWAQVTSPK